MSLPGQRVGAHPNGGVAIVGGVGGGGFYEYAQKLQTR